MRGIEGGREGGRKEIEGDQGGSGGLKIESGRGELKVAQRIGDCRCRRERSCV